MAPVHRRPLLHDQAEAAGIPRIHTLAVASEDETKQSVAQDFTRYPSPTPTPIVHARQLRLDSDDATTSSRRYSSTVTVQPSATKSSSSGGGGGGKAAPSESSILAGAVATTHLSWWQLFALIFGCVLALCVGGWALWRHRRKKRSEAKKKREALEEDKKRAEVQKEKDLKALIEANTVRSRGRSKKRRGEKRRYDDSESESDWSGSETDDSMSDGGTIRRSRSGRRRRPRGTERWRKRDQERARTRDRDKRRYGHRRRRGRRDESETEVESDYSDETYYASDRGQGRYRDRRRYPTYDQYTGTTQRSSPPATTQTQSSGGTSKRRKRDTFRDSVFSSIDSMKRAAVRLKYVEAKVKLKKQLEDEEKLEEQRREKIREANREIDEYNRQERIMAENINNQPLLIPPAPRSPVQPRQNTAASSNTNYSGFTRDSPSHLPYAKRGDTPKMSNNHRQLHPPKSAMKTPTRPGMSRNGTDPSLDGEISHLLGGGGVGAAAVAGPGPGAGAKKQPKHAKISPPLPEPQPAMVKDTRLQTQPQDHQQQQQQHQQQGSRQGWFANTFQSDWLGPPASSTDSKGPVLYDSPRTSVYLAVTHPKERPIIPRGGLAPAPPPKARVSGSGPGAAMPRPNPNPVGSLRTGYGTQYQSRQGSSGKAVPGNQRSGTGAGGTMLVGRGGSKWTNRLRERRG